MLQINSFEGFHISFILVAQNNIELGGGGWGVEKCLKSSEINTKKINYKSC